MSEEITNVTVTVEKKPDDPNGVVRVSSGGKPEVGFYVTYRGAVGHAIMVLELALKGLKQVEALDIEPPITPDEENKNN
jgi:hypothetical protein